MLAAMNTKDKLRLLGGEQYITDMRLSRAQLYIKYRLSLSTFQDRGIFLRFWCGA
jgi:hypothetical protein